MASSSALSSMPSSSTDDLLTMLKAELNGAEQQMFAEGFHTYLKHDARKDFVINLDAVGGFYPQGQR